MQPNFGVEQEKCSSPLEMVIGPMSSRLKVKVSMQSYRPVKAELSKKYSGSKSGKLR